MAELAGFFVPRSPEGRASLLPPPPWHYSGELLTIEYRTDPAAVAELLPAPLEPADDDPGAVAVIWADWQSCSDNFDELLDPVRAQYKECFVVVRCRYQDATWSRCVYIWVDKDIALVRGLHQGYPKKLGDIWMTRPVTVGQAGPRLEAGGRFGATCSANGRRLAEATFTITGPSEGAGFVNGHPMVHHRWMPAIESDGTDALAEVVTMSGHDVELGPAWTGEADLALFESPTEELTRLAPQEMIAGYWRTVGTSFRGDNPGQGPGGVSAAVELDLGDAHADLTSHDTFVQGVPHATFQRLRRDDPVSWWEEGDGNAGFWAVTRYDDVLAVSREHEVFTSTAGIRLEEMDPEESAARRTLMELDPPEHTRLRRLVNRGFTRRTVEAYEAAIRELTRGVLDEALALGSFDFTKEVGRELPMRMLGRLMGLPDRDLDKLVAWGDAMIGNTDPEFTSHPVDLTDTDEFRLMPFRSPSAVEVFRYADAMARERRAEPRDDVVTRLLAPTPDGEPLSDLEFKNFFTLLVAAGNDTTRYTIAAALDTLIDHPDAVAVLQADPDRLDVAVEELLRWTTVTMHFRRTALRDTTIGDTAIRAGDKVVVWFVSANFDDTQFEDPYRFDIARHPNDHCTFGRNGPHFCLGAWLARMEVRVTFEELLPRIATVERTGPVERLRSNFINGIKHLPVRVTLA